MTWSLLVAIAFVLMLAAVTGAFVPPVVRYVTTWNRLWTLCIDEGHLFDSTRQARARAGVAPGLPTRTPVKGHVWPSPRTEGGLPVRYLAFCRLNPDESRFGGLASHFEHHTGRPWTVTRCRGRWSRWVVIAQAPGLPEVPAHPEPAFLAPWVLPVGETATGPATWDVTAAYHCLVVARTGWGKALALDTPVPTPTGWTTMGELAPGGQVFDERGQPCTILATTETMHDRSCYAVEFDDGSVIVADTQHQWLTETRAARRSAADRRRVLANPMRAPYHDQPWKRTGPALATTEQIRATLHWPQGAKRYANHSIGLTAPLQYPPADLPVDPYVLGAWLGDGYSSAAIITTADSEIVAEIESAGYVLKPTRAQNAGKATSYRIYGLQKTLRLMGVLNDKHIPRQYLHASVPQRLALLQGLMDTDGTAQAMGAGACRFSITRQVLAEQVLELIIGLGIKARMSTSLATLYGKPCGTEYGISFVSDLPVFRLPRKLNRQKLGAIRDVQRRRYVTDVRPVPSVPVRCIQVDSPNRLYLAGRSCIPTHNSSFALWLGGYVRRLRHWQVEVIDPSVHDQLTIRRTLGRVEAAYDARDPLVEPTTRILLVIDETRSVLRIPAKTSPSYAPRRDAAMLVEEKFLDQGGKRGVHVLALTVDARADAIGGHVRSCFDARLAGWLDAGEYALALDRPVPHARKGPRGRGWWRNPDGTLQEVQAHLTPYQQPANSHPAD
jgi:hypothetical protein